MVWYCLRHEEEIECEIMHHKKKKNKEMDWTYLVLTTAVERKTFQPAGDSSKQV